MDASLIRQKILDLAIRGKLISQNPSDEPSLELLSRIHREKLNMIDHGELRPKDIKSDSIIREDNESAYIEEFFDGSQSCKVNEIDYKIPSSWSFVRLSSVVKAFGGKTPSKYIEDFWVNGSIPWTTSKDMKSSSLYGSEILITEKAAETMNLVPANSVLVVTRSGILRRLFPVCINREPTTINQDLKALVPIGEIYADWIACVLRARDAWIRNAYHKDGTTVDSIIFEDLLGMPIPIPPLAEQKRIVVALDEYLGLIDEIEKGKAELDDLVKKAKSKVLDLAIRGKLVPQLSSDEPADALLQRIHEEKLGMVERGELKPKDVKNDSVIFFGEDGLHYERIGNAQPICIEEQIPFELPDGWAWSRLLTPVALDPKNSALDDGEATFLPMASIEEGLVNVVHPEVRKWGDIKKGFTQFANGDVVFAKISPCFENGKYFIADNLTNGIGAGTTELFVLRSPSVGLDKKYLFYFLASSYFVNGAKRTFMGTVGQQRIKRDYLEETLIPVPPLAEQKRIVEACDQLIDALESVGA